MPNMPTLKPLPCGDTGTFALTFERADLATPIALTGATFKFGMKKAATDVLFILQKTSGSFTVTDAPNGKATFLLTPTDTAALPPGSYAIDIVIIEGDGTETSWAGTLQLVDHPSR
jgi:hypothetical protein